MPPSATTLRDSAGVRLGRSLSRIRRRSGLHHTRNAHAHCPSEPPGSSIPIGRKPSQPPRPSGLPHCFTYTASQPRERERERELSPLRRRPSLSSPLHVCLYTRIHSPSFLICPCVYKRARARFPSCTCTSSPSLCTPRPYLPTLLFSATDRSLIRFRFQPEGQGESLRRGERATWIQATLRANRGRKRGRGALLARAPSRGFICVFLCRENTPRQSPDQTPRDNERGEKFEWRPIMRLHLNNMDWAYGWGRGALLLWIGNFGFECFAFEPILGV